MRVHGYSFPALLAYTLVNRMFGNWAIPQNWLLTPDGRWIATQLGYESSDANWEHSMLQRLEAAKLGKPPAGVE
jgi:hypothetical protein